MIIGRCRHGSLPLRVAHARPLMTYLTRAGLRAVGRPKSLIPVQRRARGGRRRFKAPTIVGLALSETYPDGLLRAMARQLSVNGENKLWRPKLGIRFSSSPSPKPATLYPSLDMPRFIQTASSMSTKTESTGESFDYHVRPTAAEDFDALAPEPRDAITQLSSYSAPTDMQTPSQPPTADHKQAKNSTDAEVSKTNSERGLEIFELPSTPLSFKISPTLFHAARTAKAGSLESFWSHTMYQRAGDQGVLERVKVHYCTSRHTTEQVCQEHFLGQAVLGFDLEWLPYSTRSDGPRENVSLIQIASPERIGLFHVAMFAENEDFVPPTLRSIMEDPNVSKVGVQIQGDCTRMKNYLGVQCQGIFELSHLYKQVKYTAAKTPELINRVPVALSTQVLELLGLPLFKGEVVRSSNWMKRLNCKQVSYSASDAYAGVQLYHVLESRRKGLDPCPPRPHHAELGLPIPVAKPKAEPDSDVGDVASDDSFSSIGSVLAAELLNLPLDPIKPLVRDPRILAAEERASEYRKSKKKSISAQPAALRAYFVWHSNVSLKPEAVARLLRDPPLKTNTVVSYILNVIVGEKMAFDKKRLKSEVLLLLDERARVGIKYGALVRSCESSDEATSRCISWQS